MRAKVACPAERWGIVLELQRDLPECDDCRGKHLAEWVKFWKMPAHVATYPKPTGRTMDRLDKHGCVIQ
jgi:hypothetical protein